MTLSVAPVSWSNSRNPNRVVEFVIETIAYLCGILIAIVIITLLGILIEYGKLILEPSVHATASTEINIKLIE